MSTINEIKNLALFTLGFPDDIDFTDLTNKKVIAVNKIYSTAKSFVLSNYYWRFAAKRLRLENPLQETDTFTAYAITDTFTANAGTDYITSASKTFTDGEVLRLTNSGGALPAGLAAATNYYVINASSTTCQLSLTSGGTAIDITDAGTGTHTLTFAEKMTLGTYASIWDGLRVQVSSATTLPSPLAASTDYYVVEASANVFKLSLTKRGTAVVLTTAGTGVHTITFKDISNSPYKYLFEQPSDCLAMRSVFSDVYGNSPIKEYELDLAGLHVDTLDSTLSYVYFWYVSNVDERDFPAYFVGYFKYLLASELCFNLTGDAKLKQELKETEGKLLITSRNIDAKQNMTRTIKNSPFVDIRV